MMYNKLLHFLHKHLIETVYIIRNRFILYVCYITVSAYPDRLVIRHQQSLSPGRKQTLSRLVDAQSTVAAAAAVPPMPSAAAVAAAELPPSYSSLYPEIPREAGPMYPGVPQETSVSPQLALRVRVVTGDSVLAFRSNRIV